MKPATYGQGHSLGNTKKIDCGSNTREICYAFSCEIGVSLFLSQVGHREAGSLTAKVRVSEAMSFLRHKEIYQSDEPLSERARLCGHALAHRLDEFPVGYSLASCSPAELASASPTVAYSAKTLALCQALFSCWTTARRERKTLSF